MKILAGHQLKIINATRDANGIRKFEFPLIEIMKNIVIKHPPTKPSIPSIKFVKFMIAVPIKMQRIMTKQ